MNNFLQQISSAKSINDIVRIRKDLITTELINRRTNEGREQTRQLEILINEKFQELYKGSCLPF